MREAEVHCVANKTTHKAVYVLCTGNFKNLHGTMHTLEVSGPIEFYGFVFNDGSKYDAWEISDN